MEGCVWGGGTAFDVRPSGQTMRGAPGAAAGAGTAQQSQASPRTLLLVLAQALLGWARIYLIPSLGLHKKISPAGRETCSVFWELYQVLAKEIRTSIMFLCSAYISWCICMNARLV